MANKDLLDFINAQRANGVDMNTILNALKDAGWQQSDIDEGVAAVEAADAQTQPETAKPEPAAQPEAAVDGGQQIGAVQDPAQAAPVHTEPVDQPIDPLAQVDGQTEPATAADAQQTPDLFSGGAQPAAGEQSVEPATLDLSGPADATAQPGTPVEPSQDLFAAPGSSDQPIATTTPAQSGSVEIKEGLGTGARIGLFAGVAILIAAIIGGGLYAYFTFFQSSTNPADQVMANLGNLQTVSFELESGADGALYTLTGDTTVFSSGDASGMVRAEVVPADGSGEPIVVNMRFVEGSNYLSFESVGGVTSFGADALIDQWILLDEGDELDALVSSSQLSSLSLFDSLSDQDQATVRNALTNSGVVEFSGESTAGSVNGVEVEQYAFTITEAGLTSLLQSLRPVLLSSGQTAAEVDTMITEANASLAGTSGTAWIGKDDAQLHRVELRPSGSGAITLTLSNHNKALTVAAPEEALTQDQVPALLLGSATEEDTEVDEDADGTTDEENGTDTVEDGEVDEDDTTNANTNANGSTGATNTNAANTNATNGNANTNAATNTNQVDDDPVDTDGDGLTDAEEAALGTDPEVVDTDADGLSDLEEADYNTDPLDNDTDDDTYLDGEEVENGYSPTGPGELEATATK